MSQLAAAGWPAERLPEALALLAKDAGLSAGESLRPARGRSPVPEGVLADPRRLAPWIAALAREAGVEAEERRLAHGDIERQLRLGGPMLLRCPGSDRFLAVMAGGGRRLRLLAPDLSTLRVPLEDVRAALCAPMEDRVRGDVDAVFRDAGTQGRRLPRARRALLAEMLAEEWVGGAWMLSPSPGAPVAVTCREARLVPKAILLVAAHAAQLVLFIVAWALLGRASLEGQLDAGWLLGWGLVLLTIAPLRILTTWLGGSIAVAAGGLLRQRLLLGASRLRSEEIRGEGAGSLLGRVLESEAVEQLALSGGYLAFVAMLELLLAFVVLGAGAGGMLHVLLLALTLVLAAAMAFVHVRRRRAWTEARLRMARDLVEGMVGHRTRLAQQPPALWHDGEDRELERGLASSERMDRSATLLSALPHAWLVVGILGLVPAFAWQSASPAALAIGLGGILLTQQALSRLVPGITNLAGAGAAWEQVALLARAAEREDGGGDAEHALPPVAGQARPDTMIEARELTFAYPGRAEPVLSGASLVISRGERILLEGPSGGGKSTLASLLAGLRSPGSGLLLLDGVDRPTLGQEGWRRRVASAPQFHENHVLTGPLGFNLLMGRSWWHGERDARDALDTCRALGLENLLQRMPAGLLQPVGETGWQLSHGEKSRVFLARALLQGSELVILDESFAALDPVTMRRCLACVLERAPTLLVIAHP